MHSGPRVALPAYRLRVALLTRAILFNYEWARLCGARTNEAVDQIKIERTVSERKNQVEVSSSSVGAILAISVGNMLSYIARAS
jgi:hypothetical protein